MRKIRVLIVDDSALARALLRAILEEAHDLHVVGEAANGAVAVHLVRTLKPDLVTMDLEMPVMGGMEAISEIMADHPVPILVVSSVADAQRAYAAIAVGALDAVNKPECNPQAALEFVAKVRLLARVPVITHLRNQGRSQPSAGMPGGGIFQPALNRNDDAALRSPHKICAIAASTGGPRVLATILAMLPANLPCPVLIAQHIADGFANGMIEWLSSLCQLPVHLAREGELPQAGTIYLSPSELNLTLAGNRHIALLKREAGEIYHPTCDVMLNSVARVYGADAIGVILTGMGNDGAAGMARLRAAGAATIAQDEASSVIFGMNKVAIDCGAVQQVLPAAQIAAAIVRLASPAR